MKIIVWIETRNGQVKTASLEALGTARTLAEADSAKSEVAGKVESLLAEREAAREGSDWTRADEIRDELAAIGIVIEVGPGGPVWHIE